jgi:hypothetical protein
VFIHSLNFSFLFQVLRLYDFLKIDCQSTYFRHWLNNERLDFPLSVSERTGEILHRSREAEYKNLIFKITPSEKLKEETSEAYHCTFKGSLHKYSNDGYHNTNDFSIKDFNKQVEELTPLFDISPKGSVIRQFEYGVNILLTPTMTVNKFLRSIISTPTKRFATVNTEKLKIGKVVSFSQFDLKLYDKGRQSGTIKNRLLRVELRIKDTRFLEQYGLKEPRRPITLHQLTNTAFAAGLGEVLIKVFNDIIFIERGLNTGDLSPKEREQLTKYQNPLYWEECNRRKRYKDKVRYQHLIEKCNPTDLIPEIKKRLADKVAEMTFYGQKKGDILANRTKDNEAQKKGRSRDINVGRKCPPIPPESKTGLNRENAGSDSQKQKEGIKRFCASCGRDISHQKTGSKFCSEKFYGIQAKRCRNKASNTNRNKKLKQARNLEREALELLARDYLHSDLKIIYTRNDGKQTRTNSKRIKPIPWKKRQKIIRVRVKAPPPLGVVTLTTLRAKKFIKMITNPGAAPG